MLTHGITSWWHEPWGLKLSLKPLQGCRGEDGDSGNALLMMVMMIYERMKEGGKEGTNE